MMQWLIIRFAKWPKISLRWRFLWPTGARWQPCTWRRRGGPTSLQQSSGMRRTRSRWVIIWVWDSRYQLIECPKHYAHLTILCSYTDSHPIVGHILSNVLSTFRSAGGPVLQLPTAIATLATLEYLAEKSLSMIGWETGHTNNPILYNNSCNQV